jgi:hypothetical protein
MFEGVPERLPLRLTGTRSFSNGNVVTSYECVRKEAAAAIAGRA